MTDKVFIDALSASLKISKKKTKEFVDAFEVVLKELIDDAEVGDKIRVADLTLRVKPHKGRYVIHPTTKEKIYIPESKKILITVSENYKELIND